MRDADGQELRVLAPEIEGVQFILQNLRLGRRPLGLGIDDEKAVARRKDQVVGADALADEVPGGFAHAGGQLGPEISGPAPNVLQADDLNLGGLDMAGVVDGLFQPFRKLLDEMLVDSHRIPQTNRGFQTGARRRRASLCLQCEVKYASWM